MITRANGSDLGSFLDEGFQKGQRIRLAGTGTSADGDYLIVDLGIGYLTVTPAPPLPGATRRHARQLRKRDVDAGCSGVDDQPASRTRASTQGNIHYNPNDVGRQLYTGDLTRSRGNARHARDRQLRRRRLRRRARASRLEGAGGGDVRRSSTSPTRR